MAVCKEDYEYCSKSDSSNKKYGCMHEIKKSRDTKPIKAIKMFVQRNNILISKLKKIPLHAEGDIIGKPGPTSLYIHKLCLVLIKVTT